MRHAPAGRPHRLSVAAMAIVAAGLLAGCGEAGEAMKTGFEDGFREQFRSSFDASCTSGATSKGIPQAEAATVCGCAADHLAGTKSASELTSLSPEDAMPILTECAKKAGFEI